MSNTMRLLATAIAICFVSSSHGQGTDVLETLKRIANLTGKLHLRASRAKVIVGEDLRVDATFTFETTISVTNPYWDPDAGSVPVKVAVLDREQNLIGWHYLSSIGSPAGDNVSAEMRSGRFIGRVLRIATGNSTRLGSREGEPMVECLGPGSYFLKAILSSDYFSSLTDWSHSTPREEWKGISNLFPVEVVAAEVGVGESEATLPNKYGRIDIESLERRIVVGGSFKVRVTYTNTTGQPTSIFSPFSRRHCAWTGTRVLASKEGSGAFNMLPQVSGIMLMHPLRYEFVTIPIDGIVGKPIRIDLNRIALDRRTMRTIVSGEYELVGAYTDRFFSKNPFLHPTRVDGWRKRYKDVEVVRSKPIRITILPGK